ncbi:MAG: hypothetical protein ACRC6K_03015 [Fusobacteriaceae bacterium]
MINSTVQVNRIKNSYKVEVYGESVMREGEEYATLISRDIYRDEILARKSITRLMDNSKNGLEIRLSIKEGKENWTVMESLEL